AGGPSPCAGRASPAAGPRPCQQTRRLERSLGSSERRRWSIAPRGGGPRSFRLLLGLLQQSRHVGPQLGERLPLLRRQLLQGRRVADAGEVAVLLPVLHGPLHLGAVGGLAALELLRAQGQV